MWIKKKEVEELAEIVKGYIDGSHVDIRDNREGSWSILKNDIYNLANIKEEQLSRAMGDKEMLSEYMADISHQLKTPITSMMIMADLLQDADPEHQEKFIYNIKQSLSKMEWLVSGLLKMAKLDSKTVTFHKEHVSLSDLLKQVMPSVEILLEIKEQSIEINHDTKIYCDKKWTSEALINIVKNAIEHSVMGGKIGVDSGENPIYYWISVTDSGKGMQKEQYAALFKKFEYSTGENGYGIGMPLALSIMRGQLGDIDIDFGGNGKGATFIMKFYK